MDKERIINALAIEFPHSIKEQKGGTSSTPDWSGQDFDRLRPLIHELAAILKEQEEFSRYTNLMITQGSRFMPDSAASFLCQRASKVGREIAVDNLAKVLSTKEADLLCILVLRGIRCEQEVQLRKDVRLLPIPFLPPSRQRDSSLAPSGQHDYARREEISAFNPSAIIMQEAIERAALVVLVRVQHFCTILETLKSKIVMQMLLLILIKPWMKYGSVLHLQGLAIHLRIYIGSNIQMMCWKMP
ncbi:hypothetical protein [Nitrospira sp. Ecomares 2.1]